MSKRPSNTYIHSFAFGLNLIVRISLLTVPILIWFSGMQGIFRLHETALFTKPELAVLKASLDEATIKKYEQDISGSFSNDLTIRRSGKPLYVLTSRRVENDEEFDDLRQTMGKYINSESGGFLLSKFMERSTWDARVAYKKTTPAGYILTALIAILGTIICLALYFPIVVAILNLFKRRKKPLN